MSKYFLAFHTVFLLNEHIDWLEDFIKYYLNLGFEHFYLYDNDGSNGNDGSRSHNKYGFAVSTENTAESERRFEEIKQKYPGKITHIKWQPRNSSGNIVYDYNESIYHLIRNYGHETEWVAFMDVDEYLYSKTGINLVDFLKGLDIGTNSIKLLQKKFVSAQLSDTKPVFMDPRCVDFKCGEEWAPKWIGRIRDFQSLGNMHNFRFNGSWKLMEPDVLRFNHYNTNDWQLNWMTDFYRASTPFTLNSEDNGMKERYSHLFSDRVV